MKRTKLLLSGIALFTLVGVALAFTPKSNTQQCLYIPNTGGPGCIPVGKVNAGANSVTGALLAPNPDQSCPPPPASCNDEVDIQQEQ